MAIFLTLASLSKIIVIYSLIGKRNKALFPIFTMQHLTSNIPRSIFYGSFYSELLIRNSKYSSDDKLMCMKVKIKQKCC